VTAAPDQPIRVLLVDDHEMLVESLVRLLRAETDIDVVGVAYTGEAAVGFALTHQVDIIVMDYGLPDFDGATAAKRILEARPEMQVILLTGSRAGFAAFEAARAGCAGYLEKTRAIDDLIALVRAVHEGLSQSLDGELERLPSIDELSVRYQPIVDLATTRIVGFEALVRWEHPTRGLVAPSDFIPLAEHTSLIIDIGTRVREIACQQTAEWQRRHPRAADVFVSVNLSGRELALVDLASRIESTLETSGLDARSLIVEVTETFLVDNADANARRLQELREMGVRIALDDFGVGYSSLDYLRRFPIDIVKLDRTFTEELPDGERSLRLVDAVGQLSASMGAVAHAEGIETLKQADCLRALGWPLGQGYYFSRPVAAMDAETLLS
jgi:EAL domain-containing protein (putative c-di-GMP-specific phosphodiesterase class I)